MFTRLPVSWVLQMYTFRYLVDSNFHKLKVFTHFESKQKIFHFEIDLFIIIIGAFCLHIKWSLITIWMNGWMASMEWWYKNAKLCVWCVDKINESIKSECAVASVEARKAIKTTQHLISPNEPKWYQILSFAFGILITKHKLSVRFDEDNDGGDKTII